MRLLRPVDPLIACPRCGGTWFTNQEFRQYRGHVASSAPGGDISPVSEHVLEALVCLCGAALPPPQKKRGSQDRSAYESFVAAWQAALSYRETLAATLLAALDGRFASAQRLQSFIDRLEADESVIKQLKK